MTRHLASPSRQRGVAVVTALLLTTLAITIVASLFWQQQVQVRSIENQRLQLQKQWVLRGALDWAALILREDAKHSSVDTLDEPWAVPLADTRLDQYVENGRAADDISDATLSGYIQDAQSRYNLANLYSKGNIDHAEVTVFARLLDHLRIDPSLAQATAELMASANQQPDTASIQNSAQVTTQPLALTHVDDLLAIPGFTPQALHALKDYVIFLPRPTPVNVNTAPAEVLAARVAGLSFSAANSLIQTRETASFRDLADFSNRLSGQYPTPLAHQISVSSNYFLVNGKVRMNRAGLEMQALMERNAAQTKLIQLREH